MPHQYSRPGATIWNTTTCLTEYTLHIAQRLRSLAPYPRDGLDQHQRFYFLRDLTLPPDSTRNKYINQDIDSLQRGKLGRFSCERMLHSLDKQKRQMCIIQPFCRFMYILEMSIGNYQIIYTWLFSLSGGPISYLGGISFMNVTSLIVSFFTSPSFSILTFNPYRAGAPIFSIKPLISAPRALPHFLQNHNGAVWPLVRYSARCSRPVMHQRCPSTFRLIKG